MGFLTAVSELIFPTPKICPLCNCRQDQLSICKDCKDKLENIKNVLGQCSRCGTFGRKGRICDNCRDWPRYITANFASVPYQGEFKEVLHKLKFNKQGWLAPPLIELIVESIPKKNYEFVIPVPLHRERFRERGFNQTALLAKMLAKNLQVKYNDKLLIKKFNTPHQTGLTRSQRRYNLVGAFAVTDIQTIKNKKILLFDDVITSGATLYECAKTLNKAGAKNVTCATWAAGVVF